MTRPLPIAVLASGAGTTLRALAESVQGGHLPARIAIVVTDRAGAGALEQARQRGLPTEILPRAGLSEAEWSDRLSALLHGCGVELVVLAGFRSILPPAFLRRWEGRVINLHPSLLPRFGGPGFYGPRVFEAILSSGETETGVTVHVVTDEVDAGPILEQRRFPIEPGENAESLRERARPYEVAALESVIRRFADGVWSLPFRPAEAAPRTGERRGHPGA